MKFGNREFKSVDRHEVNVVCRKQGGPTPLNHYMLHWIDFKLGAIIVSLKELTLNHNKRDGKCMHTP